MIPEDSSERFGREAISRELVQLILESLRDHVTSFSVAFSSNGIVLQGFCDSYYAKQMVQEIIAKSTSLRIEANELVVQRDDRLDRLSAE